MKTLLCTLTAFVLLSAMVGAAAPAASPAVSSAMPSVMASPVPASALRIYTGQLLDIQKNFVFFSSGDAYRLAPHSFITVAASGKPLIGDDVTGLFGQATFAQGSIIALAISPSPFPSGLAIEDAHTLAVSGSTPYANPDLGNSEGFTGAPVLVTFTVQVPPGTAFGDSIYVSTEASNWDPMAIRMDRIDALHFRITRRLGSGTHFVYRYTRGSWRSAERGRNGLEDAPRSYIVNNLDVARRSDVVYHWSDESLNGTQPVSPDSIPTPVNGRPF